MNARTSKAQLHLAPERHHNPYADYYAEIHDLFGHAMDRALGVQKASLRAVVKMQNDIIEVQKHAFEGEPAICNVIESGSQTYATGLQIQLSWLNLMVEWSKQGAEMWFQLAAVGTSLAGLPAPQPHSALREEEYEESISYRASAA